MTEKQYYKVLSPEGQSLHGGDLRWSLPTQRANGTWKPGKWQAVEGDVIVCSNGLHLTTEPGRWYTKDCVCYAAEGKGASDSNGDDKTAFAQARLLYPIPHPQWWIDALAFVASIPDTPFFKPDGNPLPEWKLSTAPTLQQARNAARVAAKVAARAAAWAAAGDAAWDATRNAARNVARDVAWDAALYVQVIYICADLELDQNHIDHVKARWEVWQKGYCLLGDIDGVLYVYAKDEQL